MNLVAIALTFLSGCVFGVGSVLFVYHRLMLRKDFFEEHVSRLVMLRVKRWEAEGLCPSCGEKHSESDLALQFFTAEPSHFHEKPN